MYNKQKQSVLSNAQNHYKIGSNTEPTLEEINKVLEAANKKVLEETKRTEEIIRKKFKEIYG